MQIEGPFLHIELGNTSSLSDEGRALHENVIYLLDSERKPTNHYTLSDENKVALCDHRKSSGR